MPDPTPVAIIVMGVSGCGKSTVGRALAAKIGCVFYDADDFHPPANKEKMRAGIALDDTDRAPWLATLNAQLRATLGEGGHCVLACSALKARYRAALRSGVNAQFVHLIGSYDEIATRLATRAHEYMPANLLKSQFATLEPPADAIDIPVTWSIEKQVAFATRAIFSDNYGFGV